MDSSRTEALLGAAAVLAAQQTDMRMWGIVWMCEVVLALVISSAGAQALAVTRRWLIAIIVLKLVAVLLLFPFYQSHYRGENYLAAADRIMKRYRTEVTF